MKWFSGKIEKKEKVSITIAFRIPSNNIKFTLGSLRRSIGHIYPFKGKPINPLTHMNPFHATCLFLVFCFQEV